MREIKFRGKKSNECHIENGKMKYGKFIFGSLININGSFHITNDNDLDEDGHHIRQESDEPTWVEEDTIGQYTGLKDSIGKEIFEGDIIRAYRYNPYTGEKKAYYYDVQWDNDIDTDTWGEPLVTGYEFSGADIEVVGNIFDNPELL